MHSLLGFDVDGVLANSLLPLLRVIKAELGIDITAKITTYDFWNDPEYEEGGLTEGKMMQWAPNGYTPVPAYRGAREVVEWIWERTSEPVHFVTTRVIETAEGTFRWLSKLCDGIPFGLSMLSDKSYLVTKGSFEWFVEDRLETALALAKNGVKVILPVRSWNRTDEIPVGGPLRFEGGGAVYEVKKLSNIPEVVSGSLPHLMRKRMPRKVAI